MLVEPSREFSRRLQDATGGKNPYGGAVGIAVAGLGVARRFVVGRSAVDGESISQAIHDFCINYVSNRRPSLAWEWQDLVEEYSRQLRRRADASQGDMDIWNQLRDEENAEKDLQIKTLREQLEALQNRVLEEGSKRNSYIISSDLTDKVGKELYENEFSDRILRIIKDLQSGKVALDDRTKLLIGRISAATRFSGGAGKLEARIKNAGRDSSSAEDRLGELLIEVGFRKRSQGHAVYISDELQGFPQQTLSNSPSDWRGGRNAASQIVRDFGLSRLQD